MIAIVGFLKFASQTLACLIIYQTPPVLHEKYFNWNLFLDRRRANHGERGKWSGKSLYRTRILDACTRYYFEFVEHAAELTVDTKAVSQIPDSSHNRRKRNRRISQDKKQPVLSK